MNFRLPFDSSVLEEMRGKSMMVSENHKNEALFTQLEELIVGPGGDCVSISGGRFEVDNALRFLAKGGLLKYSFDGLECRNGAVFVTGWKALEEHKDGFERATLHETKLLTQSDCGVCVSSYTGAYEDVALPRLLASLDKSGFDMTKVVVVIGGDARHNGENKTKDGVLFVRSDKEAMGFLALSEAAVQRQDIAYWMLLHDTCEVERSFKGRLFAIDVGLHPDAVLLNGGTPTYTTEIGLYSSAFILRLGQNFFVARPGKMFDLMVQNLSVLHQLKGGKFVDNKDVYGTGTEREIVEYASIGLRKYRGKIGRGGKP